MLLDGETLLELANEFAVKVSDVEQVAGSWDTLEQVYRVLVSTRDLHRLVSVATDRRAAGEAPLTPAPRRQVGRSSGDTMGRLLEQLGAGAPNLESVGAEFVVPGKFDRAATQPPRGHTRKFHRLRRRATPLSPRRWWDGEGSHPRDVRTWLEAGHESEDPVERHVVKRLRRLCVRRDQVVERLYVRCWRLVDLARVLWFESTKARGPGYRGVVKGKPRGELARMLAYQPRGGPIHPDNLSRLITQLKGVLWGVLEVVQPPAAELERGKVLPHSVQVVTNGTRTWTVRQCFNVYRWRDASFVEQLERALFARPQPDDATAYLEDQFNRVVADRTDRRSPRKGRSPVVPTGQDPAPVPGASLTAGDWITETITPIAVAVDPGGLWTVGYYAPTPARGSPPGGPGSALDERTAVPEG